MWNHNVAALTQKVTEHPSGRSLLLWQHCCTLAGSSSGHLSTKQGACDLTLPASLGRPILQNMCSNACAVKEDVTAFHTE